MSEKKGSIASQVDFLLLVGKLKVRTSLCATLFLLRIVWPSKGPADEGLGSLRPYVTQTTKRAGWVQRGLPDCESVSGECKAPQVINQAHFGG